LKFKRFRLFATHRINGEAITYQNERNMWSRDEKETKINYIGRSGIDHICVVQFMEVVGVN